ncbi:histidine kinase [Streptomyces sp. WMMC500]|uniref:sensor histidine kinase n=1 Tax=Streptomyces sp. WMMC500 TaxID=3015154 RepID=UPI00248B206F|nr:histidine kinase [Streptomyces sp. WMMC500]WBB62459.1 histidine kinase [Streptomyces sp. WMMC500]
MRISGARLGDAALAAAATAAGAAGTRLAGSAERAGQAGAVDAGGLVLFAAPALALAVRRRWPAAVFAVAAGCTAAYLLLGYAYGPILAVCMIAVYTLARHTPLPVAAPGALAALLALLPHLLVRDHGLGWSGAVPVSAWVVVPFALGYALRLRWEAAVRARAEVVRRSVDDERLRVAQEVHDIVGHGLAAIKMQADVALHVLAKKPAQAEVALEAISRTSSAALEELRATLAVVRRTGDAAGRTPGPGLTRLDELRQRMAEAGVYVRLDVSGRARVPLPAAIELTGYRIVQESLTNVLRHSGARQAAVRIRHERGSVLIAVSNPFAGEPAGEGGSGIAGMRARVRALGGEFTAGPVAPDTFEVRARLPTGGSP